MVAASAIAILIDIVSSISRNARSGALEFPANPAMAGLPLTHAFFTARVNRAVSTLGRTRVSMRGRKEMFGLK
jgi:hypothetical protein